MIPLNRISETMQVSVVICCFNSSQRIPSTLKALAEQSVPGDLNWEIVLVDNNSNDNTSFVASNLWTRSDVSLIIINEPRQGQMWARFAGFRKARGSIIACVDDDNSLCVDYIAQAVRLLEEHPEVGAVGGQGDGVFDGGLPPWMQDKWPGAMAIGPQLPSDGLVPWSRGYLYGAGLCFRKELWLRLERMGWEPLSGGRAGDNSGNTLLLSGDDIELCLGIQALGFPLYYCASLRFGHHIPSGRLQWSYWLRLYEGFGASNCGLAVLRARLHPSNSKCKKSLEVFLRAIYSLAHVPLAGWFRHRALMRNEGDMRALKEISRAGYALGAKNLFWEALRASWPSRVLCSKATFSEKSSYE